MRYTEEHVWIDEESDGDAVSLGVTEHALEVLGKLVFVELPETGDEISADDEMAVIEGAETAFEILAPLDGEIVEVNEKLISNPELINQDPTGDGWLIRLQPADPADLDDYLSEEAYLKLMG